MYTHNARNVTNVRQLGGNSLVLRGYVREEDVDGTILAPVHRVPKRKERCATDHNGGMKRTWAFSSRYMGIKASKLAR